MTSCLYHSVYGSDVDYPWSDLLFLYILLSCMPQFLHYQWTVFLGSISVVNFQVSYYLASVEIFLLGLHCRLVGYVEFWFILDDFFFFSLRMKKCFNVQYFLKEYSTTRLLFFYRIRIMIWLCMWIYVRGKMHFLYVYLHTVI